MPQNGTKKTLSSKLPGKQRQRLTPEDRRKQILTSAISFFAEHGFEGGTRDLAKQIGVTQSLIYNYFPLKEELIREVYQSVYVGRWRNEWSDLVVDRTKPLKQRLIDFYMSYTNVIFSADWLRIYLFSGLKGLEINTMWITFVEENLIQRICNEIRREMHMPSAADLPITNEEIEAFWLFHSGIFYYGVRREIYHSPVHLRLPAFVENSVDAMLAALPAIIRKKIGDHRNQA